MELLLSGLSPTNFEDHTWSSMRYYVKSRENIEYIKFNAIITAILTAGRIAAGGDPGDAMSKSLRAYQDALFPEVRNETLEKARRTEKIIKEESAKGPIKFKALSHTKKRQRR